MARTAKTRKTFSLPHPLDGSQIATTSVRPVTHYATFVQGSEFGYDVYVSEAKAQADAAKYSAQGWGVIVGELVATI